MLAPADAYFRQAWAFCQSYLGGEKEFLLQTSGSTGEPKPIIVTRRQMQASAYTTQQALNLKKNQNALVCLNVGYIAGIMMLVRGLEIDLTMYVIPPSSDPFLSLPEDIQIDFAAFVPLQLQTLLEKNNHGRLNQLKVIIVGGAVVNSSLLAQIQTLKVPVFSTYGMTETVSHVALRKLNGEDASDYFQLLEGIEAATDERGCLRLKGAVTNEVWIQTNDVVEWIDHHHFRLVGRADNIINSGGVKIQLEKIERAIEKIWDISARYFVWWKPDERLGQKLILVVENDQNLALIALKVALEKYLTPYEIPKEIIVFEKFVETPTGKVDKQRTFAQNT
ncbi:MAG: AMP-binding protein [Spirosomataceae bacterium]